MKNGFVFVLCVVLLAPIPASADYGTPGSNRVVLWFPWTWHEQFSEMENMNTAAVAAGYPSGTFHSDTELDLYPTLTIGDIASELANGPGLIAALVHGAGTVMDLLCYEHTATYVERSRVHSHR